MKLNIPPSVLKLLLIWYRHIIVSVWWNMFFSDNFSLTAGVRQGGVLSPILYCVYNLLMVLFMKHANMVTYKTILFTVNYTCRVARTHSRYWKLIKFHQASPPFLSSTINFNPNPNPTFQLSYPSKSYPNSLQTLNTHLFVLDISLLCLTIECFSTFLLSI